MKELQKIRKESIKEYQDKADGVALDSAAYMTQQSHPEKGPPIDIPIPTKEQVMDVFKKASRKRK